MIGKKHYFRAKFKQNPELNNVSFQGVMMEVLSLLLANKNNKCLSFIVNICLINGKACKDNVFWTK